MLNVREETVLLPHPKDGGDLLAHFESEMKARLGENLWPTRFVVNETTATEYRCDIAVLEGGDDFPEHESIFEFQQRDCLADGDFNIVMIVPTGIGAEYGAHAGDATPAARLLASTCDKASFSRSRSPKPTKSSAPAASILSAVETRTSLARRALMKSVRTCVTELAGRFHSVSGQCRNFGIDVFNVVLEFEQHV